MGGCSADIRHVHAAFSGVRNITFHGHIPHAEVNRYLASFDVLLLPNQKRVGTHNGGVDIGRWTSPLKAFEYMAAGKAILCSDIPVLREVFEHGVNALLCPPENVAAWKDSLTRLDSDISLRSLLGKSALHCFNERFSWDARVRNIFDNLQLNPIEDDG